MAIIHTKTQPNGAVSGYHKVHRIEVTEEGARAIVNSWATEQNFLQATLLNWQQDYHVPFSALSSVYPVTTVEEWLVSPAGPFDGGTVVVPEIDDIKSAKAQRWAKMKDARNQKEWGGFSCKHGWFDSDPASQRKITSAVQAAQLARANGSEFKIEFTRRDNQVAELDAAAMIEVGLAMYAHIDGAHQTARMLRLQIEVALTLSEVAAVVWPVPPGYFEIRV